MAELTSGSGLRLVRRHSPDPVVSIGPDVYF